MAAVAVTAAGAARAAAKVRDGISDGGIRLFFVPGQVRERVASLKMKTKMKKKEFWKGRPTSGRRLTSSDSIRGLDEMVLTSLCLF